MRLGDQSLVDGLDQRAHALRRAVLRAAHSEETATCKRSSGGDQGLLAGAHLPGGGAPLATTLCCRRSRCRRPAGIWTYSAADAADRVRGHVVEHVVDEVSQRLLERAQLGDGGPVACLAWAVLLGDLGDNSPCLSLVDRQCRVMQCALDLRGRATALSALLRTASRRCSARYAAAAALLSDIGETLL